MSALEEALLQSANRPGPLVSWLAWQVNPTAELRGLQDGGGTICDFRPGHEERNPSLSVNMLSSGMVVKRFGGDGFEGGAVAFTMACLGVSKAEAARLLIERAGVIDTASPIRTPTVAKAVKSAGTLLEKLEKLKPIETQDGIQRLRGWVQIKAGEGRPEALEIERRGLTPALTTGLLIAYRFAGHDEHNKRISLPRHILPGAVAFEIRGPDGQAWACKIRNSGSKAELSVLKAQRYVYLGKGQSTPAWCNFQMVDAAAHVIVEGELNGVAVALALEAAGYGVLGVQGVASAEALPHVSPLKAGQEVYVYADADQAGVKARKTWAGLLAHLGVKVYQLPTDLFGGGDACDLLATLSPEELGKQVMAAINVASKSTPSEVPPTSAVVAWTGKKSGYKIEGGRLCAFKIESRDGEDRETVEVLAEFDARISAEVTREDGTEEPCRVFELQGTRPDGGPMNPTRVNVTAAEFSNMNWPVEKWGANAIVRAGLGKKDKAREAIQQLSKLDGVAERTVYQYTGWLTHPEHGPVYLTAGAVIGAAGGVQGVDVELFGRLSAYALPDPSSDGRNVQNAVRASLALLELAPDCVSVPVLGAVYRAPLGRLNAAVWLTGETGRNKTAFLSLAQSHYGAGWNAEHLPDGWNSSANALERAAFVVKDALFLIDDFKPSGNTSDTAKAQGNVARILQGVADGQGRGTLTADRKSRAGLYPRGTVLSSAETLPRGHSNRARAVLVEVERKLIDTPFKSETYYEAADQAAAGLYALALAGYIQALAERLGEVRVGSAEHKTRTRELAPRFEGTHGRTGPAAAELAYGWICFLSFAAGIRAITEGEAALYWGRVVEALKDTSQGQGAHLTEEDPVNRALSFLSELLAQKRVYLEALEGGVPDRDPEAYGWEACRENNFQNSEAMEYQRRPSALLIGWQEVKSGDVWAYLLPDALHEILQGMASKKGSAAFPDASQLWTNMRDRLHPAGLMRCEAEKAGRVRAFHKVTVKGQRTRLLALRLPLGDLSELGAAGTMGTDSISTLSGTTVNSAPIFRFISSLLGTVGTEDRITKVSCF